MEQFTVTDTDASVITSVIRRHGPLTTKPRGSRKPFKVAEIRYVPSYPRAVLQFRGDVVTPWATIRTRAMLDLLFEAADRADGVIA